MAQRSAGILMHRHCGVGIEVLLVHPGGPFWAKKDDGAWSIPKGLFEDDEDPLTAAKREFLEEVGTAVDGEFVALGSFKQPSGKQVLAWAVEGDCDARNITSNTFEIEWPPRSGRRQQFPEVDRAAWFDPSQARIKLQKGQVPILEALVAFLD